MNNTDTRYQHDQSYVEKRINTPGKYQNSVLFDSLLIYYRLIYDHEKTQLEIDEEIIRSFDKLYPNNFCLSANPELLEGILNEITIADKYMDTDNNGIVNKIENIIISIIIIN